MQFEIDIHITTTYTPRECDYGTDDPLEMLRIDIETYRDEPQLVFLDDKVDVSVSGRILKEGE